VTATDAPLNFAPVTPSETLTVIKTFVALATIPRLSEG